jgi:C2H2-type zinc finger
LKRTGTYLLGAYVLADFGSYLLENVIQGGKHMVKCSICNREFKNPKALGGHMSSVHPKQQTEQGSESGDDTGKPRSDGTALVPGQVTGDAEVINQDAKSQAEQIREYLKQGFTLDQLKVQFGFKETTIRQEIAKLVHPEGERIEEKDRPVSDAWPLVRKTGGGQEVLNPEAMLVKYMDGGEHEEWELRGMMKLRAAMLMVMDLVAIQKSAAEADARRLEPILRLMKETREEQDAAAARAKSSSFEMAREAAQDAVNGVLGYIEQNIPKGPPPKTVDEAYAKRIDKVMDMMWNVMEQQMFPSRPLEGWETENVKASAASPQQANQPDNAQNPIQQPNLDGWETEARTEDRKETE